MQLKTLFFLFILAFLAACQKKESASVNLKFHRFDEAFFAIDTNQAETGLKALAQKYPDFNYFYFTDLMTLKAPNDSTEAYLKEARQLLCDKYVRSLQDTIRMVFGDFKQQEKQLNQAFGNYHALFPNDTLPDIYLANTVYGYAATSLPFPHAISLGLDTYLGEKHTAYGSIPNFQNSYIRRLLIPEYVPIRAMEVMIEEKVGTTSGSGKLLDNMIQNGKKLYLLDLLLPNTPDSLKLGYTTQQTKWCSQNEVEMWTFFTTNKLLYSVKAEETRKYITESPNSPSMPPEAPGKTANYIGWRIVQQYMKNNPNATLDALLREKDAQRILDLSKFKPKK